MLAQMTSAIGLLPVPIEWIVQGGAAGLLGVVVVLILVGRLVPMSAYKQLERDRDHWRDAAIKAIGHSDVLLPAAQITTQVTQALAERSGANPPGQWVPNRGSLDAAAVEQALGGRRPGEETP